MEKYELMGGKLHLYKRPNSSFWQCSSFVCGRNWRISTKQASLAHAKRFAEEWYIELRVQGRSGLLKPGRLFSEAADQFLKEYIVITQGERSPQWVEYHKGSLRVHLLPFFGKKQLSEITPGLVQEYRLQRAQNGRNGKAPARNTIKNEMITLRQVLKTAHRHGWIQFIPDVSPPYKTSGKVTHRAWFSPQEYRDFYRATRQRAKQPLKEAWRWECEQLHDLTLFAANTGLRPDELGRLQDRDIRIVKDRDSGQIILEIEVRGKTGVEHCKSMPGAVLPYRRIKRRNNLQPTDRVFPKLHRALFNAILDELNLKFDRNGNRRTLYSLRHSYICFRLMAGADIYQVAKNCRTSVEMIEKHYAPHIKNLLNAAVINVRRPRPRAPDDSPSLATA